MKLTSLEITLPDGRKFIVSTTIKIDSFDNLEVAIHKLHQLVEIGDEKTLNMVETQIEKDLT